MNKRNKTLIILSVVWILVAIIFIILGFALSGYDIIGWFSSKYAVMLYTFLGVYALVLIIAVVIPSIMSKL